MQRTMLPVLFLVALLAATAAGADSLDPIFLGSKTDAPAAGHAPAGNPPAKADATPAHPVQVDKENSRITVTGRFTGSGGMLELGSCTRRGKTFLSVLVLDARPGEIVEALRQIGVEPGTVPVADPKARTATAPTGRKITCVVEWQARMGDKMLDRSAKLEQFFWHRSTNKVLAESPWIYAGSTRVGADEAGGELLAADLSGSVASVTRFDTSALFYYGGLLPQGQVWSANPDLKAPKGTPCRLVLEPVPEPAPPAKPEDTGQTEPTEPAKPSGEKQPPGDSDHPPDTGPAVEPEPSSDNVEPGAAEQGESPPPAGEPASPLDAAP